MSSTLDEINALARLFKQIDKNSFDMARWKNIPLVRKAFQMIKKLPLRFEDEINPCIRIDVIEKMLGCTYELDTPRFSLSVREYQLAQFDQIIPNDTKNQDKIITSEEVSKAIEKLRDYINPALSVDEFCKKYDGFLKFDPIERSETWENIIYDVENETHELTGEGRHMGFCHKYWSEKRKVLMQHGINWDSPPICNPGVMFD